METALKTSSLLIATTWIFFFLGWLYLSEFYGSFQIDINTLDFPFYYPVVYSIVPLSGLKELIRFTFGCAAVIAILWIFENEINSWLSRTFNKASKSISGQPDAPWVLRLNLIMTWLSRMSWVIVALSLLSVSALLAVNMGQQKGKEWHRHPAAKTTNICLSFKKEEEPFFDSELVNANANGKLMLLAQTKDLVLVFTTNDYGKAKRGVFIISRANLLSIYNDSNCMVHSKTVPSLPTEPKTPKLKHQRRRTYVPSSS